MFHASDASARYLLEGSLRVLAGGETFTMEAGDTAPLPKGKPHGFLVTGEQPARVLMTLSRSAGSDYESMFGGLVGLAPTDLERVLEVWRGERRRVHHRRRSCPDRASRAPLKERAPAGSTRMARARAGHIWRAADIAVYGRA